MLRNVLLATLLAVLIPGLPGCHGGKKKMVPVGYTPPASHAVVAKVQAVRESVKQATRHSQGVATAIQQAKATSERLDTAIQGIPGVPEDVTALVADLHFRLGQAQKENEALSARLDEAVNGIASAETKISEYDVRVAEQTAALNTAAERANRLLTENSELTSDRNHWRSVAIQWRVAAFAVSAALVLYLLRGPIFFLLRKCVGIPV